MKAGNVVFCALVKVLVLVGIATQAHADIVFQSATDSKTQQNSGTSLISVPAPQWLGVRFPITTPTDVTSVGGEIFVSKPGGLFAAIVSLSSATALPQGVPFTANELLGDATFTASGSSTLVTVPMSLHLNPGEYGLVFGSGLFGTTGDGAMGYEPSLPNVSYFDWYDPRTFNGTSPFWQEGEFASGYFQVSGTVPEPASLSVIAAAFLATILRRRRCTARMNCWVGIARS